MASVISAGTSTGSALNMTGDTSGALALATNNGTTAVTITTAQKVGVGVASPDATLSVNGNIDAAPGSVSVPAYGFYPLGTYGSTGMFAPAANTVAFSTSGGERMRIDSNGKVGIGTSTIYGNLDVYSGTDRHLGFAAAATLSSGSKIESLNNAGTANTGLEFRASDWAWISTGTERMRIDSSGRVQIGTTATSPASADTYGIVLGVDGAGGAYAGASQFSSNGNAAIVLNRGSDNGTTLAFKRSGTTVGGVNVTASATTYATSSDYRLKENIAPITSALAKVSSLKPVTYTWKSTGDQSEGFIAHELQEVFPDAVTGEKDAVDAEGNPDYQGIDTSFLVATLTAAIQELKVIVDAQAVEIAALKTQVGA